MASEKVQMESGGDSRALSNVLPPGSLRLPSESGETVVYRHLLCENLPEEYRLKARNQLNETDENVREGLRALRDYMKIHHLPSKLDDFYLTQFLRCHKYSIEKSGQRLKKNCIERQQLIDFFESIDLHKFRIVVDSQVVGLLPYRDQQGRTILFSRGYAWCPELIPIEEVAKYCFVLLHFAALFPPTSVNGFCYITDARCNSAFHMYPMASMIIKYSPYLKTAPFRFQRVDAINCTFLCRSIYTAAYPLLPRKITKRVHLHASDLRELHKIYDPSILPFEFGGTLGPLSNECYRDRFMDYVERFKAESAYFKSTNSKRQH